MESDSQLYLNDFINQKTIMANYPWVLSTITVLWEFCDSGELCSRRYNRSSSPPANIQDISTNQELFEKMEMKLNSQDVKAINCSICLSPPTNLVMSSEDYNPKPSLSEPSTLAKVSALVNLLHEERQTLKSLIFSEFRKMLSLLEETLKAECFQIFIIHTSMAAKETFQVINFFSECGPESRVVLLASLEVTGVGINLTAASCWDLDIEEQAIACVHRIGQKEEVKVMRLVVKNSNKQRIMELRGQVENNRDREMRRLGFQDIQTIMGMQNGFNVGFGGSNRSGDE
ncbi:hypothetical protein MRB53_009705 [Persea americana]|uniref:Uncharacterized protein n=1 Tax=Persea americana TaxID=3435 RepID=A0ACC2LPU7_PERAE|nr:hypothetical protein MRB53_009705 [Persea americana]